MDNRVEHKLLIFWRQVQDDWILVGINARDKKYYCIAINGDTHTKTQRFNYSLIGNYRQRLRENGYTLVLPNPANDVLPLQVLQRIQEWWKFVHFGFTDLMWGDDPWMTSSCARKCSDEDLNGQEIETELIDQTIPHGTEFGDIDNYWNQEGIFEFESDQGDQRFAQECEQYEQGRSETDE